MKKKISRRQFIKNTTKGAALLGVGGVNLLLQGCTQKKEYDVLITGGMVYDGLGNPGREMDVALKGDKILRLAEKLKKNQAKEVIEAKGLTVSPGFIDAHTHTDFELLVNPKAESKIRQGVTTEISGNCGISPFPIPDLIYEDRKEVIKDEYGIELNWKDINGFFKRLEKGGMALNYATLVGQGSIRGAVVGFNDREPTEKELKEMKQLVREHLEAGALGLSTGLEYAPGSYAKTSELIALCREVSRYNGVYATHMRDEGDSLLESIDEALTITKETAVSLQISHFKVAYPRNWKKIDSAISKLEKARQNGAKVIADRYPYIASSTGMSYLFPLWAKQGITKEFLARLRDPSLDKEFRGYVNDEEKRLGSWEKVVICSVSTEKNRALEGKNILDASKEAGKPPYDFIRDLLIEEENRVGMITFMMSEDNLKRILSHPLVVIGSDGEAVAPYGILGKGKPHPRYYGTFPRILRKYVREEKIFSLSQAIKKMTAQTAKKFSLHKRGQITGGCFADIVIFNPDKVSDLATWENPHQYPNGIKCVIVNGQIVVKNGKHTGALPGRIVKKL